MSRNLTILFICLMLSGCDIDGLLHQPFSWAVIDERVVTQKLTAIANRQNPYPEALHNVDELSQQKSKLNSQISDLKRQARDRCMKKKGELENSSNKPRHPSMVMPPPVYRGYQGCSSEVNNDPLITDLLEKRSKIDQLFKQKRVHDQKIRDAVKTAMKIVVKESFQNKFDLILIKRENIVMYNQSNLVVDVTGQLIEYIQSADISIPIDA